MGKSVTPKYAIDIYTNKLVNGKWVVAKDSDFAWDIKSYGRPTEANLEKFVMVYGKSLEVGGTNAHISDSLGYVPYPVKAVIRLNHTRGTPVAEWKAAPFQTW